MRLTLRTLLAYMDNLLEPKDAEALRNKIDESEVATQLTRRIEQLTQQRTECPPVSATGIGKDPNSVAQYLDNTLSADDVPEFERVTLDSDPHLSEVAACHQILTLVLGKPVPTPASLKQRIYQLNDTPATSNDAAPVPASKSDEAIDPSDAAAMAAIGDLQRIDPPPPRIKPDKDERWTEAPDYLRKRTPFWKHIAIACSVALLLLLIIARSMGPFDRRHPWAVALGFKPTQIASKQASESLGEESSTPADEAVLSPSDSLPLSPSDASTDTNMGNSQDNTTTPSDGEVPTVAPATGEDNAESPSLPDPLDESTEQPRPEDQPDDIPLAQEPLAQEPTGQSPHATDPQIGELAIDDIDDNATPVERRPSTLPDDTPDVGDPDVAVTDDTDADPQVLPEGPTVSSSDFEPTEDTSDQSVLPPPTPSPAVDIADLADGGTASRSEPSPTPETPALINPLAEPRLEEPGPDQSIAEDTGTEEIADSGPVQIGVVDTDDQVLLRMDPETETWQRLQISDPLLSDDLLMVLPIYRPEIMLGNGTQAILIGPTRAGLRVDRATSIPRIHLEYGRVNLTTFAQNGSQIEIATDQHTITLTLGGLNSRAAVEVKHERLPGSDLLQSPPHKVLTVYPVRGDVRTQVNDQPGENLSTGSKLVMLDDASPVSRQIEQLPGWIDGSDAQPRDPLAATGLSTHLTQDRPIMLVLREQTESKKVEVRSLAAISLGYLGDYDPLVASLQDSRLKSYWSEQYDALQQLASMSTARAADIRRAIEMAHPEDGDQLFRLLGGYNPEQLRDGGASTLVNLLEHESSDFRVAAIDTLREITGSASLYMPHFTPRQRRSSVFRWKNKLQEGEIQFQQPPELAILIDLAADSEPVEAATETASQENANDNP